MISEKFIYVYTYTEFMATKTISITDEVYGRLIALKGPEESFSDELRRLTEREGKISDCLGSWSDLSKKTMKDIRESIKKGRRSTKTILEKLS